jgi:hypothetical protein
MAYGSIKEVESDLIRAYDAGLLTLREFEDLARQLLHPIRPIQRLLRRPTTDIRH